jgi:hypothetical protein
VKFIETPVFTQETVRLMSDDDLQALQAALMRQPDRGAVLRGSGGLRKVRWMRPGKGKRGGLRVIYSWHPRAATFYLLLVYPKSRQEDLTPAQVRVLRQIVREEFP